MSFVPILQAICGALWLIEAAVLVPGLIRVWRARSDALDAGRIPIFVFALVQVGFSARWFIWPHAIAVMGPSELAFWAACYSGSAASALACILMHRAANRGLR